MEKRRIYCGTLLIVCLIIGSVCASFAKTGYVSDMLILTLRNGPGTSFKVLKTLKSNDAVEVFEEKNGYYRVTTADGIQGWVEKQYITDKIPHAIDVARLQKQVTALEKKNNALSTANAEMIEKIKTMQQNFKIKAADLSASLKREKQEKENIQAALDQARKKYDIFVKKAGNSAQIINKNKKLNQENVFLSSQIKKLTAKDDNYFRAGMIKWFLAGAGVLVIGWLIGTSIKGRKKTSGRFMSLFI